ncbi:MAG TPA: hypothetical protein VKA68_05315 [bacterium]|nr:hypothetical protein [bacterium]
MKTWVLTALFVCLVTPLYLFGHGTEVSEFTGGVGIQVAYEYGAPMAGASVRVYAPGDTETPFQQGATDQNGRFTFTPDTSGTWKIDVDDGTGHGVIEEIVVSDDMIPEIQYNRDLSAGQQILIGVSVIFGITGIGFYWSTRKSARK